MFHPTVRDHFRHDRDPSPINDQQRDLETHDDPCAFHEVLCRLNLIVVHHILLSHDIKFVRDPHLVSRQTHLLVSMILHLRDLVTCLQDFDVISPSGPSDICPSRGWTNPALDAYASMYSFWKPDRHIYDHPVMV